MVGLYIAIPNGCGDAVTVERLRTAVNRLQFDDSITIEEVLVAPVYVAKVVGAQVGFSTLKAADGTVVICFGWLYPRCVNPARTIAEQYAVHCERFVEHVNGEFNAIIYDPVSHRIVIANDRWRTRPWYTARSRGMTIYSPGVRGLLPLLPEPTLDRTTIVSFLRHGKFRLGNRTVFEQISALPAATVTNYDLNSGSDTTRHYFQYRFSDNISDTPLAESKVDELVELYRSVMDERISGYGGATHCVSLSGGLDSRSLVAAIHLDKIPGMRAVTFGLTESDEVRLAKEVADAVGLKQYIYPINADSYIRHARHSQQFVDELDYFVQGAYFDWMPQAANKFGVVMNGIGLDEALGGYDHNLLPSIMAARDDEGVALALREMYCTFSPELLAEIIPTETLRRWEPQVNQEMLSLLAGLPQELPQAKYDLFLFNYNMGRVLTLRYGINRYRFETATPLYDYDVLNFTSQLPFLHRFNRRIFGKMMEKLSPVLNAITYQWTLLPANVPISYWWRSQQIEAQREKLLVEIWRDTGLYIPYRRYYSNFDEWLRVDPGWRALTDELLLDRNSRIYQLDLVLPDPVAEIVELHRKAAENHRQRIISLMSLELYLREYVS